MRASPGSGRDIGYTSLDEELKPLQEMVTTKGMSWPQIHDADKSLVKLFNVKGTPTYYLIDREGKIVAKDIPMKDREAQLTIS
jgi:thioredoxin-related protein